MNVPVIAGVGRANKDKHEEHIFNVLHRLHSLRPGALLVDVGVNIGQTLIKYSLIAGKDCRYIGFEPNTKAASYVEEIMHCNGLTNAQVVPIALGSDNRLASLFMAAANSTDPAASINSEFRDRSFYGAKKLVPVFDADSAMQALEVRDRNFIVKIDVEGAELEVLRGMQRTLAELRPFLIAEILPPANFSPEVNDYRLQQASRIKALMRDLGFTYGRIGDDGGLLADGEAGHHDYLFVPVELAMDFPLRDQPLIP